jgi:glucose-6-phosphate 1-dehydrogenase
MRHELPSTSLLIFGATGDLSRRYLLPALSEICESSEIRTQLKIVGLSRQDVKPKDILPAGTSNLAGQFEVFQMDYTRADQYHMLKQKIKSLASEQVIFYFAVPPDAVPAIIENLGKTGLNHKSAKLLLEKPFGTDLASAKKLIRQTAKHFTEEQVYRIDHYLAKTVAQNNSVFLSSNALFRQVWNKDFIEYIEIVVAEKIGLEKRAAFYEQTGALRDIVQSHLVQLAVLTLMDPCSDPFELGDLPARRLAALRDINVTPDFKKTIFRAQYEDYRKDVGNPKSRTETFVALQLVSKNPRWRGVPIYMATGKNLDQRLTQIRVSFKKTSAAQANTLILRIQPREGIELDLWVKKPGYQKELDKKTLSFSFEQNFDRLPDAYEQVLVDAIRSDHSLFAGSGEVVESWRILQPVLDYWRQEEPVPATYKPGSSIEQILENT